MLVLVLMAALLWFTFDALGFRKTALVEEWGMFWSFDNGSYLDQTANRFFGHIPRVLGYWLTPNSFVGMNIVFFWCFLPSRLCFTESCAVWSPKALGLRLLRRRC